MNHYLNDLMTKLANFVMIWQFLDYYLDTNVFDNYITAVLYYDDLIFYMCFVDDII